MKIEPIIPPDKKKITSFYIEFEGGRSITLTNEEIDKINEVKKEFRDNKTDKEI